MTVAIGAILACSAGTAIAAPSATSASAAVAAAADSDGDGLINSFERNRSHTDPFNADTNGNGIRDGREDPDHDGLNNLWEQRLGLNPLRRDTDGDGIPDGHEDYDHDGLTNLFEIKGKVSDPRTNDTNADGVRDSAEDPDGDLLSNLGEQRWHTKPGTADTNRNGVPDGAEDANGNGITNAAEQDDRHVPRHLVPSIPNAFTDLAQTYFDGCNIGSNEHVYRHCSYGDPNAAVSVALFGDSHASQWFSAVFAAAQVRGWRVDNYTRSACPSADVKNFSSANGTYLADCTDFRRQALAGMATNVPTIVLLASRTMYPLYDANDQPIPAADFESTWDAGLARMLNALPSGSIKLVLEDTPLPWTIDVPKCLAAHPSSIAACEGSRSAWINAAMADGERTTALANGAKFGNLTDKVCPYDPCGVVFGNLLAYRDISHITATFAASLAPSMGSMLDDALAP